MSIANEYTHTYLLFKAFQVQRMLLTLNRFKKYINAEIGTCLKNHSFSIFDLNNFSDMPILSFSSTAR